MQLDGSLQILAAGAPILSTVAAGFTTGFSAIFLPQLEATSSAVRITNDEGSWLASIAAFGKEKFFAKRYLYIESSVPYQQAWPQVA